jgi:arabinogalactan oligomer / maltooligosaccharide transport system substrate-binding protein
VTSWHSLPSVRRFLVLVLTLLLAACVPAPEPAPTASPPGATRPPATPTPRPTAPPPVTAVPAPTAPPGALVLWAAADKSQQEALQRIIDGAVGPSGPEVQVVGKSADGLLADLRASALGGLPPPDLIWGTQDDLGILQQQGWLQPAGDRLNAAAFIPATVAGATVEGQRWGTPLAALGSLFLLYNKRLVDQPPRTSDELIVASRAFMSGNRYGLVAGWAEPRWLAAWLAGMGGAALAPDGTPSLDTPQMVAALNLLKELRPAGPPPPATYAEGAALFQQGRAAFALDGDWSLAEYRRYTDTLDLGIAPMPTVPGTGRIAAPPLGGIYLMYSKALAGTRLDRARALGAALAQPAAQARIAREMGLLPALRAALGDPAVAQNPALAAAAAQVDGAPGLPPTKGLRCAWDAIKAELPPMLLGETAQEDAARLMQASATNCMAGAP